MMHKNPFLVTLSLILNKGSQIIPDLTPPPLPVLESFPPGTSAPLVALSSGTTIKDVTSLLHLHAAASAAVQP